MCYLPNNINKTTKKVSTMFKKIILASAISIFSITSSFAAMVNVNHDDAATISKNLKGIGMVKAKAIVTYRKENGKFNSADDLTMVKGIGAKTVEKNRDDISVEKVDNEITDTEE